MVAVEQRAAGAVIKLAQMAAGEQAPVADGQKIAQAAHLGQADAAKPQPARVADGGQTARRVDQRIDRLARFHALQIPEGAVGIEARPAAAEGAHRDPPVGTDRRRAAQICAGMVSRAISRGGCPGARSHTASARS
jgi:hypothetical protein